MRVETLLGFARRAGLLAIGSQAAKTALEKGKVHLLMVSSDASSRTWRNAAMLAEKKNIPIVRYGEKEQLAERLGWSGEVAVLAVTQEQFARDILRLTGKDGEE